MLKLNLRSSNHVFYFLLQLRRGSRILLQMKLDFSQLWTIQACYFGVSHCLRDSYGDMMYSWDIKIGNRGGASFFIMDLVELSNFSVNHIFVLANSMIINKLLM